VLSENPNHSHLKIEWRDIQILIIIIIYCTMIQYQAVWSPNPDLVSPAPFNLSQSQQCYLHMWQYSNFLFCSTSPGTILNCAYSHVENNLWKNKGICIHNLSSVGTAAKW